MRARDFTTGLGMAVSQARSNAKAMSRGIPTDTRFIVRAY